MISPYVYRQLKSLVTCLATSRRVLAVALVALCLSLTLFAERQPFERYQSIVDRQMFGPPPEGFDPTKPPSEAVTSKAAQKAEQELSKEQEKIKSSIRFSMINVTPAGETAVGFTDSSEKPPKNYYLKVGETSGDGKWTVKEADPAASTMTIVSSDNIEVALKIGGDSGKGAGKTAAAGGGARSNRSAPSASGLGSLRVRRSQRRAEEQARMAEMEKKMQEREAAFEKRQQEDAARREEEKQRQEEQKAEREEQRKQLLQIQEELRKAREAKAKSEDAESGEQE